MNDTEYMRLALELAKKGCGRTSPNPMVGAVIVKDGQIIGQGWHERYGQPHAERNALASCAVDPEGATMYVTLEPCPMCSGAIINSRLKRVVYGARDPKAGCCGALTDLFALPFNHHPVMEQGLLEEEAQALLQEFVAGLRAKRLKLKAEMRAQQSVPLLNEENPHE